MTKLLAGAAAAALVAGAASAQDDPVRLGLLLGYTGPIESMVAQMAPAAEAAIAEVNAAGTLLGGVTAEGVRADTGCIDNALATSNAERLIGEGIDGLIGGDCSGVTGAVLQTVAIPNGMVMISPSATSPALSTVEDEDLFFRTAPSDAREGEVMAQDLIDRGITSAAVTYTNNDFGKGQSDSFVQNFEALGGEVTIVAAHEDGRADYSAEVGSLASAGGDILVVAGYADQGGLGIIRSALDTGAFDQFVLPNGMISDSLTDELGASLDGSFGQVPGSEGPGAEAFAAIAEEAGFQATGAYAPESYDAAALFLLAMQKAGSQDPAEYGPMIMEVANAPGEPILPGELDRALQILADGGDVDYQGATGVEFVEAGESTGSYRMVEVEGGEFQTVGFR
jgi:branched-chain amino acid transport system substrate-binding protein